jgi:replication-associated recombination protein RarA
MELQLSAFAAPDAIQQTGFDFPVSLTEKYRPHALDQFVGLDKVKRIAANLIAHPRSSAWLFLGPSGTGKTSMGLAIAELLPAELHLIPSQECNLANIDRVRQTCQYVPRMRDSGQPCNWHLVLADEIDQLTPAAQISLLSKLDSTNFFPNTIFIGTCNATDRLEPRFLSRFHVVEFSSYGIAGQVAELLADVWRKNVAADVPAPNFARIVKDSSNNVREALMRLETEIMAA